MIVKEQKPLHFIDSVNCRVDFDELAEAIHWYNYWKNDSKPIYWNKKIYMFGKYPAVTIHKDKVHIHRLLMAYWNEVEKLPSKVYVHHLNHNKKDARRENLMCIAANLHQSYHNKGKVLSDETKKKISEANKRRKGMKYKIYENPELIK